MPRPTYPPLTSLKDQIKDGHHPHEIRCPDKDHVLTERPNDKLACVTEETAHKLNWKLLIFN